MRLALVGAGIEHVLIGRRDVHVAADDHRVRPGGDHVAQRRQPRELVLVVIRPRGAAVRNVDRDDPDARARRCHRARLLVGETGAARQARDHVVQPDAREDRHAVPCRLAVCRDGVPRPSSSEPSSSASLSSASLVSCRQTTSGRRSSSHGSSRGRRCLIELTFQVAMRTAARYRHWFQFAPQVVSPRRNAQAGTSTGQATQAAHAYPSVARREGPRPARLRTTEAFPPTSRLAAPSSGTAPQPFSVPFFLHSAIKGASCSCSSWMCRCSYDTRADLSRFQAPPSQGGSAKPRDSDTESAGLQKSCQPR